MRSSTKNLKCLHWSTFTPKIGRMRLLSSPTVVASAEQIGRKINETYVEQNKTFLELQKMIDSNAIDILGDFSKACREEFESLGPQQF
jgi:hypothetical protein